MSFRALVEKSPAEETRTNVHVMRRSEGEPPYLTAQALRRASPLARGGSPPRNPPQKKREQAYTLRGGTRASRPTVGYAVNRTRLSLRAKRGNLVETKCRPRGLCAASAHLPARAPRPAAAHRRKKRFARFCRENRFLYTL